MFLRAFIAWLTWISRISIASTTSLKFNQRVRFTVAFLAFRKYYYPGDAYGKSKLAQVFFTKHLDNVLKRKGLNIQVHSTHPGIVNTDLFEHSSNTYIPWFKDIFYKVNLINITSKHCASLMHQQFLVFRNLKRALEQSSTLQSRHI